MTYFESSFKYFHVTMLLFTGVIVSIIMLIIDNGERSAIIMFLFIDLNLYVFVGHRTHVASPTHVLAVFLVMFQIKFTLP